MRIIVSPLGACCGALLTTLPTLAQLQPAKVVPCPKNEISTGSEPIHCEDRTYSLTPSLDVLKVDAGLMGGISVIGTDGKVIEVRARVQVSGPNAAQRAEAIKIDLMKDGWLRVVSSADDSYSVSYELRVPRALALELRAQNGGIALEGTDSRIHFITSNGGVALTGVNGDVSGQTTNGGVSVRLTGKQWTGKGLDVSTTNGGITWDIPADYAGRIATATMHGNVRNDFGTEFTNSVSVVNKEPGKGTSLALTLHKGSTPLRVVTTNGGIVVKKRG